MDSVKDDICINQQMNALFVIYCSFWLFTDNYQHHMLKYLNIYFNNMDTLSLSWENLDLNLTEVLKTLYEGNAFTDITVVGEDNVQIHAHKFILGACSH